MDIIGRLNAAGRQAADRARESVHEALIAPDLADAYRELGRTAFELVEQGAISHQRLSASAERICELENQMADLNGPRR